MTILGFGLAHIFFQLCVVVLAGFFIILLWGENIPEKMKYVATSAILVGWFGVAIFINGFANFITQEKDDSCKWVRSHTITVDGKKFDMERYFAVCQGKDGRMFIQGPNGELKGQ